MKSQTSIKIKVLWKRLLCEWSRSKRTRLARKGNVSSNCRIFEIDILVEVYFFVSVILVRGSIYTYRFKIFQSLQEYGTLFKYKLSWAMWKFWHRHWLFKSMCHIIGCHCIVPVHPNRYKLCLIVSGGASHVNHFSGLCHLVLLLEWTFHLTSLSLWGCGLFDNFNNWDSLRIYLIKVMSII